MSVRNWAAVCAAFFFLHSGWVVAQDNADPAAEMAPAVDSSTPVLPETEVQGQQAPGQTPNPFPSEPLPDDSAVTPNASVQPLSKTPNSVTVINEEQLKRYGQLTVSEVLRQVAGVDVVRSGGPGQTSSVFIRGGNSNHTKVYLDGIALNDPSDPSRRFDFNALQVDNIERIEVLRGPQSTLYGSDAIGGVVNIITKRGVGPVRSKLSGQGGSFGTAQSGFASSGGNERGYYSVGGSYLHTDGISAADSRNGNTERDQYKNGTLSARVGANFGEGWNADNVLRYTNTRAGADGFGFVFPFDPADEIGRFVDTRNFANRFQLSNVAYDGDLQQRAGFSLNDVYRSDTQPSFFDRALFQGQSRQFDYQADMRIIENNVSTAGTVYWQEEASVGPTPGGDPAEASAQNMGSVYFQDQHTLWDCWTTTAGFRFDDHSRAGAAQTYRFGSIYNIEPLDMNFHGTLGTGFRAPALAETVVGQFATFPFTNPNLRPERSRGWDFGARKNFVDGVLWADVTYYRNDFVDLIVSGGPPTFALANVGIARSHGIEMTTGWRPSDLWICSGSFTHDDTFDGNNNRQLLRRPRDKGTVSVTRLFPDYRAQTTLYANIIGRRIDFDGLGNIVTLAPYTTLNATASWRPWDAVEFFARGDNLTNCAYQEVYGFGTPGIAGYGGVNVYW